MEQKSGWKYSFSTLLNQQIAVNEKTQILYTEDKTRYEPSETEILKSVNFEIPLQVHIIKKVFGGTLWKL